MLKTKNLSRRTAISGFALPTILVASVVMLIVLLAAVSAASSVRVALDEQYYTKLAQEAAEAGQARAEACLVANNYTAQWNDGARLRPDTTCSGATIAGGNQYVANYGNIRTTFVVWAPVAGSASYAKVTVVGSTQLIRQSSGTVHQTYSHTLVQASNFSLEPKIAGGAGWKGGGHLAVVLSTSKKLHGVGANSMGQITDTSSPASVLSPVEMVLPAGVKTVSSIATSGQGGSFVCIIADTAEAWCRGAPGGGEDGLMPAAIGWHKFGLPAGLTAVSMSVSGYGPDSMCVLASDGQGYCAGENSFGSLGINDTAYRILKIGSPERFRLDIPAPGATLRKIYTESNITCGITTTNDMYCAGINGGGSITGPVENGTGTGRYAYPIRYNIPGARFIEDVSATYHVSDGFTSVHVLGTDGTIWSSGDYKFGDFGNGATTGSTGTSQTPTLFTHPNKAYATGSEFWNGTHSGRCIDNDGNNPQNGNIIHLWDCNGSGAQTWVYGKNKQLSNLGTGKCLDVPGNNLTPGTALQLYDCNDTDAQKFDLVGGSTIVHIASGLCADTTGGGTANGTRIQIWTCTAGIGPQNFTTWTGAINGWRGMITGMNHFCGLRKDDWSGMWCAGQNTYGQLANWADASRNFMGQCVNAPGSGHNIYNVNLPGGAVVDYTKLSDEWRTQYLSTMVIATNGKVYGSGRNQFGKLGNGTLGDAANDYRECVTKEFLLPAGVTAIDMSTRDEFTTYVLGNNGRIYAAGQNNLGQVGDNSTTHRSSPVEVQVPREGFVY
ncbi:MAG: chromosome condensation regulator [Candidatus Saccharibacteria bacterium]|nr:chromosome condensation regulator [Candidatus Saccharibacteria bacterium]